MDFPKKRDPNDLHYDELKSRDKVIVLKHLKLSGSVKTWEITCRNLMNQITRKKVIYASFKPQFSKIFKKYHQKYLQPIKHLFVKFKIYLESTLYDELEETDYFDYSQIYFSSEKILNELIFYNFKAKSWELSS